MKSKFICANLSHILEEYSNDINYLVSSMQMFLLGEQLSSPQRLETELHLQVNACLMREDCRRCKEGVFCPIHLVN